MMEFLMKQTGMSRPFNSLLGILCLLSFSNIQPAAAQLNTFEAGQPIRASEMNHNFEVIQDHLEDLNSNSEASAQYLSEEIQLLQDELLRLSRRSGSYDYVEVDCTSDRDALNKVFYGISFNDPTAYEVSGSCNFFGDIAGRDVFFRGDLGEAPGQLVEIDAYSGLSLSNSTVYLYNIEVVSGAHVLFQNSHLRLTGAKLSVTDGYDRVRFDVRESALRFNGMVLDESTPSVDIDAMASKLRIGYGGDNTEFRNVRLRNGSTGWCRGCDDVSISNLEVDMMSSFCAFTFEQKHLSISSLSVSSLSAFRHAGAPSETAEYEIDKSPESVAEWTQDVSACRNF